MNPLIKRNNIKVFGNGTQPMLFAHGLGCGQNMWRFITPAFEKDYKIVLFDYVGSGKSDLSAYDKEKYSTLNGYAEDVLDVIEALQLNEVIFVGHSVSSMVGLLAAIAQPVKFSKLIFLGPSARYLNEEPGYVGGFEKDEIEDLLDVMDQNFNGWANFLAPLIMKNSDRPGLTDELKESFCSTDPTITRQFAEVTFLSDNRNDLPKLKVPSLLLQCSDDVLAPFEVGYYLERNIPGSTLKIMKATGHCPHMSAPKETINLMQQYLAK